VAKNTNCSVFSVFIVTPFVLIYLVAALASAK
jgi:hypothetical protein